MAGRTYSDDETISADAVLWRRVGPDWWRTLPSGERQVTSGAFQNASASSAISFALAAEMEAQGKGAHDLIAGRSGFGVVAVLACDIRECGLGIYRDPVEEYPGHVLVFELAAKNTKAVQRRLREAARWIVHPHSSR